ncbi:MAG: UDP-glucose 4-epimerase GalE [Luteibaculum sp.]
MPKILVTGGAGFIGSHTVVSLVNAGFKPVIMDNLSNSKIEVLGALEEICQQKIPFYQLDCTQLADYQNLFSKEKNIQAVIHFAAFKAVGESVEKPLTYYHNNVQGLIALLQAMEKERISQLVFSSSCTVYGQPKNLPVKEDTPRQQAESPYGNTKIICENIITDYQSANKKFKSVLLRYFNPIGAHPSAKIGELPLGVPNNLVPFITQTAAGIRKELTVFGDDYNTRDGSAIRDYIHVMDLADAHVRALDYLKHSQEKPEVFNVGTGQGNTVLEVVDCFLKSCSKDLAYKIGPRRPGDVESVYANTDKIEQKLNWKAQYSLEEALHHAWKWQQKLKELEY